MHLIKRHRLPAHVMAVLVLSALLVLIAASSCAPVTVPSEGAQVANTVRPLSSVEIYRKLSPSVAFIETDTGTGSGLLIEFGDQKYVVTNAHVIWPFAEARIVFPNREEHLNVPVVQTDQMVDLAVLGPIETAIPPLPLGSRQEIAAGEPVYLIGYPGEAELFPDPSISKGILSRTRVWDALDSLHYYQTDAAGAGGQSGGILVSSSGEVIGISGLLFAEAFVLAASSGDLSPRLYDMLEAADTEPMRGVLPRRPRKKSYDGKLENLWDTQGFLIQAPLDSEMRIDATSSSDLGLSLFDTYGEQLDEADRRFKGTETVSGTVSTAGPQFLLVEQFTVGEAKFTVDSNRRLAPIDDPDDGQQIAVGETLMGNIDYPGDVDWFLIPLERGQRVEVSAESVSVDPVVVMGRLGADSEAYQQDDDSGRGIVGGNALLDFRARRAGNYLIAIRSYSPSDLGGFLLKVSELGGKQSSP